MTTNIICTFNTAQIISCWIGSDDFINGDASKTVGLAGVNSRSTVFAGLRDDPGFFNADGLADFESALATMTPSLSLDGAGCPRLDATTRMHLVQLLTHTNMGASPPTDKYANTNVLSIVMTVDTALLTKGGPVLGVWASTHRVP
jgi:hypothetical protein